MITRSKSRATQQTFNIMSNNKEVSQQLRESEGSNESEEINNQLGIPGIYDEMTPINVDKLRQQEERPNAEVQGEAQRRSPEFSETGAGGQVQITQESGLGRIFLILQHMQEDTKEMKEEIKTQNQALKEELRESEKKTSGCTKKQGEN